MANPKFDWGKFEYHKNEAAKAFGYSSSKEWDLDSRKAYLSELYKRRKDLCDKIEKMLSNSQLKPGK